MWGFIAASYLGVGLAAAGFTLAVFPPQTGYRPPLHWVVLAVVSYVVLWPFLAMIGLGYIVGQWYHRPAPRRRSIVRAAGMRQRPLYRTLYEETPN
jgi:uncharacterized membrane protein